ARVVAAGADDRVRAQPRLGADDEAARGTRRTSCGQARAARRADRGGADGARSAACPADDDRAPARNRAARSVWSDGRAGAAVVRRGARPASLGKLVEAPPASP